MAAPVDAKQMEAEQVKQLADNEYGSLHFKDFLTSYNKLTELCFGDCIHDFTVRDIRDKEDKCALNCMEKYLKLNQRISQRFQEFQMTQNDAAVALANKS